MDLNASGLDQGFQIYTVCMFFITGLCLGSFATAIIYRERTGQSWFKLKGEMSRSICPRCGARLGIGDLIPFFSWVKLRGRCRNCGTGIPLFYPAIEILCGSAGLIIFFLMGAGAGSLLALALLPFAVSFLYLAVFHKILSRRLGVLILLLAVLGAVLALPAGVFA